MRKTSLFLVVVLVTVIGFAMTACDFLDEALDDSITFEVTQIGGTSNTVDSTGIKFTFGESIDDLGVTAGNIKVSGVAAKGGTATFTGSGKVWTLSPITVTKAGKATVTIDKSGITSKSQSVTVHKKADITYVVAQGGGTSGTADTTRLTFSFGEPIDGLGVTAADITVSGTAAKGEGATFSKSSTGNIWVLSPITVNAAGDATVTINKTGITSETKNVTVYKALPGHNSSFVGRWKPLKENSEEDVGFYIFSSDGTYEMSALIDTTSSLVKGTWTTTGTTIGNYTLTPTHINGTVLLEFLDTSNSLFKTKLQAKWYTAEEYTTMVVTFVEDEVPAALAAETAIRYAEIDADDTKTEEEKATAKEWVDFELGLKYTLGEILLPLITAALTVSTPAVYEDPDLNGTATYALSGSGNNTLTFTVVSKEKDKDTGVITSKTATTTLKKK
jgi:hypothetical protein